MKPVANSLHDLPGSKWEPLSGGGRFTEDYGLVIIDRVEGNLIFYHYEKNYTKFSQHESDFFSFARRIP